jgi:hypothetical protein
MVVRVYDPGYVWGAGWERGGGVLQRERRLRGRGRSGEEERWGGTRRFREEEPLAVGCWLSGEEERWGGTRRFREEETLAVGCWLSSDR